MPDELSPEEKLLRLIRGGQKPANQDNPQATPASAPEKRKQPAIRRQTAKPVEKKKQVTKPIPEKEVVEKSGATKKNNTVQQSSITEIKKKTGVSTDKKTDRPASKPQSTTQPSVSEKSSSIPQHPLPPDRAVQPIQDEKKQESVDTADTNNTERGKKPYAILVFWTWIMSGFNIWNRLLLIILLFVIGITTWHIFNLMNIPVRLPENFVLQYDNDSSLNSESVELMESEPKPFPYFAEVIGTKNLFRIIKPPPPPKPKREKKEPEKPKIKIETLTRHLVLQGIVYDIGPPQAIIFNKKENKTLFLGNGAMINEIKVKEIQRGKVILEYEDQTQELTF